MKPSGETHVKLRHAFLFLAAAAMLAAGCGSDAAATKEEKPLTKAEKAAATDRDNKESSVKTAEKAFKENDKDVGACRNLAMSYIALASPASSTDPKQPPKLPEDRDKSLEKAVGTLEGCVKIDGKDRDVKQMLASTYMATNQYDKATPLLAQLARSAEGRERANAFYAWGLAASNAKNYDQAIAAWRQFVKLSPSDDPRIRQVNQSIQALQAARDSEQKAAAASAAEGADDGDDS
jgi:tetratricopeptide (TPR) repeat protein